MGVVHRLAGLGTRNGDRRCIRATVVDLSDVAGGLHAAWNSPGRRLGAAWQRVAVGHASGRPLLPRRAVRDDDAADRRSPRHRGTGLPRRPPPSVGGALRISSPCRPLPIGKGSGRHRAAGAGRAAFRCASRDYGRRRRDCWHGGVRTSASGRFITDVPDHTGCRSSPARRPIPSSSIPRTTAARARGDAARCGRPPHLADGL